VAEHTEVFDALLGELEASCRRIYGERLVSLVIFGSVGRRDARPDSDVDLLVVARDLPSGRIPRVREFDAVEADLAGALRRARERGVATRLSPIFKSPDEVRRGSPLFFDMTEDSRILVDRDGFFAAALDDLRARLRRLGAKRVWRGSEWYWDLKPDYRPGETFEI
jgi:uncharacterized protein